MVLTVSRIYRPLRNQRTPLRALAWRTPISNYNKITNFTVKDSLPSGEPDKIILGEEIDDEFDAISTAIATKLDTATSVGEKLWPTSSAETSAGIIPANLRYSYGNIRRYGAVVDGTTDDSAAVRKALDLAAEDGTPVINDPPGLVKISSTVYLPQRTGSEGDYGYVMDLYGTTFIGQGNGTGTIFESGTGTLSTGGATNFGQVDESAAALHYGTVIRGARFRGCATAIRLFNFTKGCELRDLYFVDLEGAVYTDRCFYLELHNCHAQVVAIGAADVLFNFTDTNNAMTVIGCEAGGGLGNTTGTGFRFIGGGAGSGGIVFHGNTAENVARGLVLASSMEGVDIRGNYFEATSVAGIDASAAGAKNMDVESNWFLLTTKAIDANEWASGRWGSSNYLAGTPDTVDISDNDSKCYVEIPTQVYTEVQSRTATKVPSYYSLGPSVTVIAPREVYQASTGLSAPLVVDASLGRKDVPAFAYSGGTTANGASFTVPFCSQTLSSGSSVIDTQINWNTYFMHVYFGFYTEINGAKTLSGFVNYNGTVYRLDGNATFTITASNNAGKLRLTVAGGGHTGFTSNGFWGEVRHI